MNLSVGWIIKSERLPELYKLLQYAEGYCKHERTAGWASGVRVDIWTDEITKIEEWLSEIKERWEGRQSGN